MTRVDEHIGQIADPRPDLSGDSALWADLLTRAYELDGEQAGGVYGVLDGLRCLGAQLEALPRGVRLRAGEIPPGDYAAYRAAYLVPHAAKLTGLLSGARCGVRC